jgi:large subunit ribosomal protein L15
MKLSDIRDNEGSTKNRIRVGRGIGSGKGKTGGRGVKGQKARSGVAIKGFEGGQMPLHRRLPKRGFTNIFRLNTVEVTLVRIQKAIDAGKLDASKPVDAAALVAAGVIRRAKDGIRVVATGEITAKIALTVTGASTGAVAAIEKAGGSVTMLKPKVVDAA